MSRRMAKWDIKLSEQDLTYQPLITIKSQVLTDFVTDFSAKVMPEAEKKSMQAQGLMYDLWVLHTNASSNACKSGLELVLKVPTVKIIFQSITCPDMTNNEAE